MQNLKQRIKDDAYRARQDKIDAILRKMRFSDGARLLDLGFETAEPTLRHAKSARIKAENVYGLDIADSALRSARTAFRTYRVDFEIDQFPLEDNFVDLIIADQVYEHFKNIERFTKEIDRVLKPGGMFVLSTPNLAAWHNRLVLTLGHQPLCINMFSDHVRGFTRSALAKFIVQNMPGCALAKFTGEGFYPLYGVPAKILASLFPGLAVYLIFVFVKELHAYSSNQ